MTTTQDLIQYLQNSYQPGDELAVAIWLVDDVLHRAKERELRVTQEEAKNIVSALDKNHDAETGINWDVIDVYLDDLDDPTQTEMVL